MPKEVSVMAGGSGIINRFKNLEKRDKIFLCACIIVAVGFLLPWIYTRSYGGLLGIGGVSTANGLEGDGAELGTLIFLLILASGGLLFYNRKYAAIGGLGAAVLLLIRLIGDLKRGLIFSGLFGGIEAAKISYFGAGRIMTCLGIIVVVYLGIKLLKKRVSA